MSQIVGPQIIWVEITKPTTSMPFWVLYMYVCVRIYILYIYVYICTYIYVYIHIFAILWIRALISHIFQLFYSDLISSHFILIPFIHLSVDTLHFNRFFFFFPKLQLFYKNVSYCFPKTNYIIMRKSLS